MDNTEFNRIIKEAVPKPSEHISNAPKPRLTQRKREIVKLLADSVPPKDVARQIGVSVEYVYQVRRDFATGVEVERLRREGRNLDGTPMPKPIAAIRTDDVERAVIVDAPRVSMVTLSGAAHTYVITSDGIAIDGLLTLRSADVDNVARELPMVCQMARSMGLV